MCNKYKKFSVYYIVKDDKGNISHHSCIKYANSKIELKALLNNTSAKVISIKEIIN